jgi:hypothetical protein
LIISEVLDPKKAFQRKCSISISLITSKLLVNHFGSETVESAAAFFNAAAINSYASQHAIPSAKT